VARIELWYRQFRFEQDWTRERFERLCRQLHCTAPELGAMVGVKARELNACLLRNKFPRPVTILLAMVDQALVWMGSGLQGPPIVPLHLLSRASTTGCLSEAARSSETKKQTPVSAGSATHTPPSTCDHHPD